MSLSAVSSDERARQAGTGIAIRRGMNQIQTQRPAGPPEEWTAEQVEIYMNCVPLRRNERAYYNRVLRAARAREGK